MRSVPSLLLLQVVMGIMPHEDKKRKMQHDHLGSVFCREEGIKKKKEDPVTDSTMTMVLRPRVRVDCINQAESGTMEGSFFFFLSCGHDAKG